MAYDLKRDGLVVLERFLSPDTVSELKSHALMLVRDIPSEKRQRAKSLGSIGRVEWSPSLLSYALSEEFLSALKAAIGAHLKYHVGVVFSKPAGSPPTFWHQDYFAWSESQATEDNFSHLQVLIYTTHTTVESGALRVIPGSHRRRHELHGLWQNGVEQTEGGAFAFTRLLRAYEHAPEWAYEKQLDEETIAVTVGDVVVIDTRLLHAAHRNTEVSERPLVTLGYFSQFSKFSPHFRSGISEEVRSQRTLENAAIFAEAESRDVLCLEESALLVSMDQYRDPLPRFV